MHERRARGAAKKLRAAACAWVTPIAGSGKADPDDPHADAINAYLAARSSPRSSPRSSQRAAAPEKQRVIEIAPDEVDVVALFLALQTQWRLHAMTGAATGLIYEAVPPAASMSGIQMTPELFGDLRLMESAALNEMMRKK